MQTIRLLDSRPVIRCVSGLLAGAAKLHGPERLPVQRYIETLVPRRENVNCFVLDVPATRTAMLRGHGARARDPAASCSESVRSPSRHFNAVRIESPRR